MGSMSTSGSTKGGGSGDSMASNSSSSINSSSINSSSSSTASGQSKPTCKPSEPPEQTHEHSFKQTRTLKVPAVPARYTCPPEAQRRKKTAEHLDLMLLACTPCAINIKLAGVAAACQGIRARNHGHRQGLQRAECRNMVWCAYFDWEVRAHGGMYAQQINKGGGGVARRAIPPPATREGEEGSPEAISGFMIGVFCCVIENPATQNPATHASGARPRLRLRSQDANKGYGWAQPQN